MAVPLKYQNTLQPVIPSYNYSDVDEGTGITAYNAFTAEKSTGEEYVLTTASPYSHLVSISGALGVGIQMSGQFSTGVLNRPRIIEGSAVFNMTWRVTNSSGSNDNFPYIRLYNGSTSLGYVSGGIISSAGGVIRTTALQITGLADNLIKVGEQIKVEFGIEGVTAGNSPRGHIACDPQNRDDDWFTTNNFDTTKAIANIPFRITATT